MNKSRMTPRYQRRRQRFSRITNENNNPQYGIVRPKPDHRVTVRHVQLFSNINSGQGFFECFEDVRPIHILSNSAYSHLLDIYESVRVTRIQAKIWINNVSITTPGYTAAMYYRDVLSVAPNRFLEQLIVEPGSKKGRSSTVYTVTWLPIEPTDYDFFDHAQFSDMDNRKYGQVNFAGSGFDSFQPSKPLIEFTVNYDFKSLVKPEPSPALRLTEIDDYDLDSYSRPKSASKTLDRRKV